MAPRIYTISPPTNPILQVLYFLVGGVMLIGAVLIGGIILAIALGLAVILGIVVYLRIWWLKRKFAKSGRAPGSGTRASETDKVLEAEYSVVDERDDGEPRRRDS